MYEVVFKSTKPFQRCLVSSTLQKYCENKGKTIPFPQLPRKLHVFGKNRVFLGKIKSLHAQQGKTRKNRIILTKRQENTLIFLQASPHTFPDRLLYLGKIGAFLGKIGAFLGKIEALLGKIPCFLGKW